ncbi:MAG: septum formation initiator family protein [Syntrophobacterales bacterium]|nr:septum formation initiator family protein [Syntrophobacterales bacterium]
MKGWFNARILFWGSALVVFVFFFYGIFFSPTGIKGYLNKKSQLMILNQHVETTTKENEKLYGSIKQFRSDPKCRVKVIREKLGWVHEGERRITFVPQTINQTP